MPYDLQFEDRYCYPGTAVLINKLGITDKREMIEAEKRIAYLRVIELDIQIPSHSLDFQRLKDIHKHIFQDIYDWAGMPRDVELAKGASLFCASRFIETSANDIFQRLKRESCLCDLSMNLFIQRLAEYMGDVNCLHPFREGNGRTQRQFFKELAQKAGFRIDFDVIDSNELIQADIAAMHGNSDPLIRLLQTAVTKQLP